MLVQGVEQTERGPAMRPTAAAVLTPKNSPPQVVIEFGATWAVLGVDMDRTRQGVAPEIAKMGRAALRFVHGIYAAIASLRGSAHLIGENDLIHECRMCLEVVANVFQTPGADEHATDLGEASAPVHMHGAAAALEMLVTGIGYLLHNRF